MFKTTKNYHEFKPNFCKCLLFCILTFALSCDKESENSKKEEAPTENEIPKPEPQPNPDENIGFKDLINAEQYLELFPYRYGADVQNNWVVDPSKDFFTYNALMKAIDEMGDIKVIIERKGYSQRITRFQKSTNTTTVFREDTDFNASWNTVAIVKDEVDYADFVNKGSLEDRKKELAAFLANISHETTGGWVTAPGGAFSWGLHFREEVGYANGGSLGYRDEGNLNYPPYPGQSYHGRGPIQLSWNYNYGQMSEYLYGDKNILLKNPGKVTEDGALAFKTAIWFWMTPQAPKPSCHDVMVGKWIPTEQDTKAGRKPGFGMTINIINGGLECNQADNSKTQDRRGFYERYLQILKTSDPDCICECDQMQPY